MGNKIKYQEFYESLQRELINLLASDKEKDREVALVIKEMFENIEKKQQEIMYGGII